MPLLSEQILAALAQSKEGLDKRQLAKAIALRPNLRSEFKSVLLGLLTDGKIEKTDRRKYQIFGQLPPVLVVDFTAMDTDGELLARPQKATNNTAPIIRLAPGEAARGPATIGVGDSALVRLTPTDDGYEARIIRKLTRSEFGPALGIVVKTPRGFRIESISRKSKTTRMLRRADEAVVKDGDLIRFSSLPSRKNGVKEAKLVEHIGNQNQPKSASLLTLAEHRIAEGFSPAEEEQAQTAQTPKLGDRSDLRDLPLITIDPEDARDFDDAVHAHVDTDPKNQNGWVVWVAIADVAAFVSCDSALDRGARKRGNSVYLPDRVVPMLPERLSADLCSLRPDEVRATLAVRMVFDEMGHKIGHTFVRGLMRSHARLTYEQAQAAIDGNCDETTKPILENLLKPLWGAYTALQKARAVREPLEITTTERKIRIGQNGTILSITAKKPLQAHRLIEEFMVQANVSAAQSLHEKGQPLIYRVHDTPEQAKIFALSEFLGTIGMKWTKTGRILPARFNQLLRKVAGTDMAQMVNQVVLRSQMRAIYDTKNIGHFGLSLAQYAHFTSPIRRYADLTIHRGLIRAYGLGNDGASDQEVSELKAIAEEISTTERTAMAAERDAASRYVAAYLSEHIRAEFTAHISGVTRFGLFLTLDESGADGLVPVRSLGDEYFHYEEHAHALIGRDTGGRFTLGQAVNVRLLEANPVSGGLLFEMLSPPIAGTKPKRGKRPDHHGHKRRGSDKNKDKPFRRRRR